jgi:hypothetical protein
MYSHPLLPLDAAPVLNTTLPLLPAVVPPAAVCNNSLPLDDLVLIPVVTTTSPPLNVAESVWPAVTVTLPP